MLKQVDELTKTHEFDAILFDMVVWPSICVCDNCQKRFRAEAGADIPTKIDWTDSLWCRFAEARRRWLTRSFREIEATVRRNAEIPLFNNASAIPWGWTFGASIDEANGQDLLGGDFGVGGGDIPTTCHLLSRIAPKVIRREKTNEVGIPVADPDQAKYVHNFLGNILPVERYEERTRDKRSRSSLIHVRISPCE